MTWKAEVESLVRSNWGVGQQFTLQDVYKHEAHFTGLFPGNRHPLAKLRQSLQYLRNDGLIEFLDDHGTYRRVR
jgi:type II restriction enzyme